MDIQLWSYNYEPEQLGIAPVSAALARAMVSRGHSVQVIAAHPHYPEPQWGVRYLPYREQRDGVDVLRLPIWPGREGARQRIRQELSFVTPLAAVSPFLSPPDVVIAVSPSFPAIGPAMAYARAKRVPWLLWLHDILPDGAMSSGVLDEGRLINAARRFERRTYRSAQKVVVLSEVFKENLLSKGVPEEKIELIYDPMTRPLPAQPRDTAVVDDRLVLSMGNIGHTQNMTQVVELFEGSERLLELGARMVITGEGVAADEVRRAITTDRVDMRGLVEVDELDDLLDRAALGLVSSTYGGAEFNIPSKLMNFMGRGVPVLAAVRRGSEVARIVERSACGWTATSPDDLAPAIAEALADPEARADRGAAGWRFARDEFSLEVFGSRFEALLADVVDRSRPARGNRRAVSR